MLYMIQFDSEQYWVEAESMPCAIDAWKEHVAEQWQVDYEGNEEPESCSLMHDGDVIRPKQEPHPDGDRV